MNFRFPLLVIFVERDTIGTLIFDNWVKSRLAGWPSAAACRSIRAITVTGADVVVGAVAAVAIIPMKTAACTSADRTSPSLHASQPTITVTVAFLTMHLTA